MPISPAAAVAIATQVIAAGPGAGDEAFLAWRGAMPGEPQLVHDEAGEPSYWLVPVRAGGAVVGGVRIGVDGRPMASAACRAGSAITDIDAIDTMRRAAATIALRAGDQLGSPLLVHDGPPGREAWRIGVINADRLVRWVFVTPGGIYQRKAGAAPPGPEWEA
ncbi:MAG: hypothetical protein ACOY71_12735 [Gemmatimonadota bacterium]